MLRCALLLALAVTAGSPSLASEPHGSVEQAMTGFFDALNKRDWERFRAHFADDASLFNPDIPEALWLERVDGRERIERTFASVFGAAGLRGKGPPIVPQEVRIQELGENAALVTFRLPRTSSTPRCRGSSGTST